MSDYIVRATAAKGTVRAFAAVTTQTVEQARIYHETSPIMTAALGRLLTGTAMMGVTMKGEKDLLTCKIDCDGPAKGLLVTADAFGHVKGLVNVPVVNLPPNSLGKLDVAGALGIGVLSVIKDIGLKEPYVGTTILVTSEIAEDLTNYYAESEQVPSSIGLGVLMNKDNTVRVAGGFMIQLMPNVEEEVIEKLEKKIATITSVTNMLDKGMTPEDILNEILGELDIEFLDTIPTAYTCDCSKERFGQKLITIGRKEIRQMIAEDKDVEVGCVFCNKKYIFTPTDLKKILTEFVLKNVNIIDNEQ